MTNMTKCQSGFSYLGLLFLVAILGSGTAVAGMMWSISQKRDKERELLFRGNEIRNAIASYYKTTPGTIRRYPASLADLLKDNRQLATVRHLRRLYRDPMTVDGEWGLVRSDDGGIRGVYSLSREQALKRKNFRAFDTAFEEARIYVNWVFVHDAQLMKTGKKP